MILIFFEKQAKISLKNLINYLDLYWLPHGWVTLRGRASRIVKQFVLRVLHWFGNLVGKANKHNNPTIHVEKSDLIKQRLPCGFSYWLFKLRSKACESKI